MDQSNTFRSGPDEDGHFGTYGGRFVAETLMPLILDLEEALCGGQATIPRRSGLNSTKLLKHYVGRPSPLTFAPRITERFGGAKIYFKRDELNHTGAHKINNCMGQILLARRMKQDPHHRRDRGRAARRRNRHRVRAFRHAVHGLHG